MFVEVFPAIRTLAFTRLKTGVAEVNVSNLELSTVKLPFSGNIFRWLNLALDERSTQVVFIKVMPEFDKLRSDPRFDHALRRAGAKP